jgi:hypothetical protein
MKKLLFLTFLMGHFMVNGFSQQVVLCKEVSQKNIDETLKEQPKSTQYESLEIELLDFMGKKHTFKECMQFKRDFASKVNSDDEVIRDAGKQLKIAGQLMAWGGAATAIGTLLTTFGEPVSGGLIGLGGVILTYTGYGKIEKAGRIMAAAGK